MYLHPRLLALTEGVRLRIFVAALVGLLAVAAGIGRLAVAAVLIVKVIQDGAGASFSALIWPLVAMAVLVALRGALLYVQEVISHHTASIVKIQLRKRLYEHALTLGPGYFDQNRTGDVMLSLVDGVEKLEAFFGKYLPQFIVSALAPILIFIFMAIIDLQIGFIFLGSAIFTLMVPSFFHRWTRDSSMARQQAYGALGADFLDAVQGMGTLKAFGQSKTRGRLLADRAKHLYRTTMGVLAADSATSAITILAISAGATGALVSGALRVSDGSLELRPLLIVLMLGVELYRPMHELVKLYHEGLMAMSSAEGIFEILDSTAEIKEPTASSEERKQEVSRLTPEVRFENVDFAYNRGKRPALHDVSFTLGAGETLGLVGPSGAGKSTMVWLMLRFYDPQNGRVLLGGRDLRELPLAFLREHIAVVTQDTYLFHGTVAENLRFGNPDATQEQLEVAASAANAHQFIMNLPSGYDTLLGERAVRLSGGQKQRIAIARALLKDAPILMLDEALSSVDAENEALIQEALERLMEGRTTMVIAHRLSSVVNADRILVLDDGRLIESGSHQELVAAGGTYALLMAQQQETQVREGMVATLNRQDTGDSGQHGHRETDGVAPSESSHHHAEHAEHVLTPEPPLVKVGQEEFQKETGAPGVPIGTLTVWARLLYLVKPWWGQLIFTFALGLGHHGSIIGLGVISALLVGQVITGGGLTLLLILLGVFIPMVGFFTWAESWMSHDLAYRLLAQLRGDLYSKLDPLAPAYLVRRRSGDLVSIVGGDIETIEYFFGHTITPSFVAILIPAAVLVTLGVIAWPLALVLAPFLLAVAVSPFFAQKRSERLGDEVREQIGEVHAHMVDSIQGLREISAFGRGPSRTGEMVSNGWRFAHYQLRFLKERALQIGFIEAMTALGGLAVLAAGLWFRIQDDITRPQLILSVVLSVAAFAPISDIARTMKQLMESLAASRRLFAVYDEPVPVTDGAGVDDNANGRSSSVSSIRFETVGFSYGPGEPQALHDVSFTAEVGHTVALVGRSGAGKTTCTNLLMRFWDPGQGRILLDGNDLRDFSLDHLREQIALVTQDTYLFNISIRENLRLGRQEADDADIEDAARQANAHDFIMSFPDGYDTVVGERGMQLSGGQRQRISIARALLKNSPVLVLDEATSHLDAVNEQQVRQALERLMEGRTTLVIAHRLSTIRDAHQIVVLDEGHLVDQGSHQELLERQGLYAQLVATQLVGSLVEPMEDGDGHYAPGPSFQPWKHDADHGHHH